MSYLCIALMLVLPMAWADAASDQYDPVRFEKRFHQADKGKKGKLSRKEAYAAFPRMPEFFDEIDTNKDGYITLKEVNAAVQRRVNAAINATRSTAKYGGIDAAKGSAPIAASGSAQEPAFTSEAEERRYRRMEFYESMAGEQQKAYQRGEPVPDTPTTPILVKPF